MITEEELIKAGWKKMGNAWYSPGGKKVLTNWEGQWQIWTNGVNRVVTKMIDLDGIFLI